MKGAFYTGASTAPASACRTFHLEVSIPNRNQPILSEPDRNRSEPDQETEKTATLHKYKTHCRGMAISYTCGQQRTPNVISGDLQYGTRLVHKIISSRLVRIWFSWRQKSRNFWNLTLISSPPVVLNRAEPGLRFCPVLTGFGRFRYSGFSEPVRGSVLDTFNSVEFLFHCSVNKGWYPGYTKKSDHD